MKVHAVERHPWTNLGVLPSPRRVDECQAGIPRAGGVEEVDQGVAPPGVVGGLLLAAAIVPYVLICIRYFTQWIYPV